MSGIGFNLPAPPAAPVQVVRAPVCPECRQGKHRACAEIALDERTDEIVPCTCPPAFGHEPRNGHPWEPTDAAGNTHSDDYWEESDA